MFSYSPVAAVATTVSVFDDVSNIYLFSTLTLFVAIIIALYFSNFFKDEIEMAEHELSQEEQQYLYNDMSNGGDVDVEAFNDTEILEEDYDEEEDDDDEAETMDEILNFRENLQNFEDGENVERRLSTDSNDSHADVTGANGSSGGGGGGLVGHLKSSRIKKLEAKLTQEQLEEERRIEHEQMAAIFELLKKQEAELNMCEIDEKQLKAQMNLYR